MTYDVVITPEAEDQLRQTAGWYQARSSSLEIANRWYDGFIAALESLSENPDRFPLAYESDQFEDELRELYYGSGKRKTHRAVFRITDESVEILTIRHHAQRELTSEDLPEVE